MKYPSGIETLKTYVKPTGPVKDYRGYSSEDLKSGKYEWGINYPRSCTPNVAFNAFISLASPFEDIRKLVEAVIKDRIVIGFSLKSDFNRRFLSPSFSSSPLCLTSVSSSLPYAARIPFRS